MLRSRVVFPQPLGPRRKKICPGSIVTFTDCKATASPKRFVRFSMRTEIIQQPVLDTGGSSWWQGRPGHFQTRRGSREFPLVRQKLAPSVAAPLLRTPFFTDTMSTFNWIESSAWQLSFFGLPSRVPWAADAPAPNGNNGQFDMEALVRGARALVGSEPGVIGPWRGFLEASQHFDAMTEALEDHEYSRAAELLSEIEKHHPESAYGLFHQAYVQRQAGNDQEAVRLYAAAAETAPGIPFIWDNLGTMLAENGNRDQAVQAFIRAVQVNPQDQVALESLVQFKAAVKLMKDPKDPKSTMIVPL